ncbi:Crp/Fnr family transcriptional regulator [Dyadobacter tibetensis]|uniref:Crp/Fnr family transcriptional regulator n=1 Tax=Dyadobacter tibetensis TaxID=1211851 RepID=UPI0018DE2621|nr:Crp/Fnr family transcriptional regulator [Dyadobacter tibetensis]
MMDFDTILHNIHRHIELTQAESHQFCNLLNYKKITRKTLIQEAGSPCRILNFVISGGLRSYCQNPNGKEATIMFCFKDWWVTDMYCFINRQTAMMEIEAMEDSEIFQLSRDNFDRLLEMNPKFERFFRILMQNAYSREQLRIIENLTLPAEERYFNFIEKYPFIANQVTQKQIASYLGITPEFLSVIRKNKGRGIS